MDSIVANVAAELKSRDIHAHDLKFQNSELGTVHYLSVTNEDSTKEYLRMHEELLVGDDAETLANWIANILENIL